MTLPPSYILIFSIIFIILIIYLFFNNTFFSPPSLSSSYKFFLINNKLSFFHTISHSILNHCNIKFPSFTLVNTFNITFTNKSKSIIYLVLWDPKSNSLFDDNTILYSLLHELSHILSPSPYHDTLFNLIESHLLQSAQDLGFYDPSIPFNKNYLTLELDFS